MSAKDYGWKVGMEVYLSPSRYQRNGVGHEATITKVGRDWVYINRDRFDPATRRMDSESGVMVYTSRAEYIEETEMHKAWSNFRQGLTYSVPPGLTTDAIREMAKACGVEK